MKLVLTGGTGVLGRHLVHRLDQADAPEAEVVVLTRGEGGRRLGGRAVTASTGYSSAELDAAFEGADAVVHMAASRSGSADLAEHLPSLELADRVFHAAAGRVRQIVFASSISVYGTTLPLPWSESDAPAARMPYGVLKGAAERLGEGVAARSGTTFTALRLAHLYGAGEENGYLVNVLLRAAAQGQPLSLHSPARARRDFLYAGDAARGVLAALASGIGGVFNIGSGTPVTNEELALAVAAGFVRPAEVAVEDSDAVEGIPETHMDPTRSRRELGYSALYTHAEAFAEIRALSDHPLFTND